MAPLKKRFSGIVYAGKKKPKQSIAFIPKEDSFDRLFKNNSKNNVFESSSDLPSSGANSRSEIEVSKSESTSRAVCSPDNASVPCTSTSHLHQSSRRSFKTPSRSREMHNVLKRVSGDKSLKLTKLDSVLKASTPKIRKLSTRNLVSPEDVASRIKLLNISPLVNEPVSSNMTHQVELSPIVKHNSSCEASSENSLKDDSVPDFNFRQSLANAGKNSLSHCASLEASGKINHLKSQDPIISDCNTEVKPSLNDNTKCSLVSSPKPDLQESKALLDVSEKTDYTHVSPEDCMEKLTHDISKDNSLEKNSFTYTSENDEGKSNESVLTSTDLDMSDKYISFTSDNDSASSVKSLELRSPVVITKEDSKMSPKENNSSKSPSILALGESYLSPSFAVTKRRRLRRSEVREESFNARLIERSHSESKKPDRMERRHIYMSRSLPASFSEKSSFNFSTTSLPRVLECLESSSDEDYQSPRGGFSFRRSNLDYHQSFNSPLFHGYSDPEIGKRRSLLKKYFDDSPSFDASLTLPALPENDSDSSCDSGDDSKKLESGSSSQIESPLMSPSVQSSPSRRDVSRLSTSCSSETNLSSRSEGLLSPSQDESVTPPRSSSPEVAAISSEEDTGSSPVRKDDQVRRRRSSRLTSKRTLGNIAEESELDAFEPLPSIRNCTFVLPPGKKYRRSLCILNNLRRGDPLSLETKGRKYLETVDTLKQLQKEEQSQLDSDDSLDLSPDSRKSLVSSSGSFTCNESEGSSLYNENSILTSYSRPSCRQSMVTCMDESHGLDVTSALHRLSCLTVNDTIMNSEINVESVIFALSNQNNILTLNKLYNDGSLSTWKKIGEGVYSEVFSLTRNGLLSVMKIIPVDGEVEVNGASQMSLFDNLSEVIITKYLSGLRVRSMDSCDGFVELMKVWFVQGAYTEELINLWNDFNDQYGSDNDHPSIFPTDQRFLCLELASSGKALETYKFSSARQSLSVFKQITFSLAVAEQTFEFEHRDLHWGNILVNKTKDKVIKYVINNEPFFVTSFGVKSTIIDYTWSRMTFDNSSIKIANDMEKDPGLFEGKGDLQFDIYRQMREDVERDWNVYNPKTNVRWLYYIADKLINKSKYLRPSTHVHKSSLASLNKVLEILPSLNNSVDVALMIYDLK